MISSVDLAGSIRLDIGCTASSNGGARGVAAHKLDVRGIVAVIGSEEGHEVRAKQAQRSCRHSESFH